MSRILNCECGFYISFGHSSKYGYMHDPDDPFYGFNPQCPRCKLYLRGDMEPKITLWELTEKMGDDIGILVTRG